MPGLSVARVVLEILGVALFVVLHYAIVFVYIIGGSLRGLPAIPYWSAIVLGYLAMIVVPLIRPRLFGVTGRRARFDAWLIAFPPAAGVVLMFLLLRLPLRFGGWDAHGFGASGAEANAVFLPWLHVVAWIVIARRWPRADRAGAAR